jgi:predicted O-linked N-acetylglucosamine transferase (SPINDLY family)
LAKLNAGVVALWSRILNAVHGSRLFLKSGQLGDPDIVRSTSEMFALAGVGPERLILEGPSDRSAYFEAFNRVDIALDPFPFPGGTTTAEGLWMGVPVITLRGDRFIAHNGETIAHNSGQSEWIADNEAEYLEKAVRFSGDLEMLSTVRSRLRTQVLRAPLFDSERFARNFENLLALMWDDFVKKPAKLSGRQ